MTGDSGKDTLQTREGVVRAVDSGLTTLYWHIGHRIRRDILKEKRAEYGEEIVSALRRQLEQEFGRGFSGKSLHHMIRFVEAFPDEQIVSALRRQLTWTHFKSVIYGPDTSVFWMMVVCKEGFGACVAAAERENPVLKQFFRPGLRMKHNRRMQIIWVSQFGTKFSSSL
jgi:hypothetical protein